MTFEEQLRDLVDTLADRVRHEAAGHFQSGMVDLHNAVKRLGFLRRKFWK